MNAQIDAIRKRIARFIQEWRDPFSDPEFRAWYEARRIREYRPWMARAIEEIEAQDKDREEAERADKE